MRTILTCSALACSLVGCIPDDDQGSVLFNGTFPGQSSYAATLEGNGDGLAGAAPLTAVDNGDESMLLGDGCTLGFAEVDVATDSRGKGSSVTAMLIGDSCVVPVDGGTATFDVTSGSATSTGGTSLAVSVGGNLVAWSGAPATGYMTVMFQGEWIHD